MSEQTAAADDWNEENRLLDEALDLDPGARAEWLRRLAAARPGVAARLSRLLALADDAGPLDAVLSDPLLGTALARFVDAAAPGLCFGSWVVQRALGVGGMSEVYLARRELEEGEQFAALKLISGAASGPDALAKFKREAAILSQLNDARIARLIDTGRTGDGRPWLAMEYVDGDPIDRGCDRHRLPVTERVRRMIDVAMAVDHAHRHLVVHRDIKPANVMLDADGQRIRLLDFGIAKVLAQTDEHPLAPTQVFTPQFASPEQLAGQPVSTASDVHQLGTLLYLLLTGQRPYRDVERSPAALMTAMQEAPPLPSQAVLAHPGGHGERCGIGADRLAQMLRGDLDTIVLKAMAAEPQRRYLSARDLADDLARWLAREPIAARPDAWYRYRRRLRKHWLLAAAAVACVLLILAYAATVTWQRQQLQAERDGARRSLARAEATRRFLVGVIGTANPIGEHGGARDIGAALAAATDAVEREFSGQPDVAAETYKELGLVFHGMEDAVNAERALRRSLALSDAAGAGAAPPAEVIGTLAISLADLGRAGEALPLLTERAPAIEAHFGRRSDEYILFLTAKARVEQALPPVGDQREALHATLLATLQEAQALHDALYPPGVKTYETRVEGVRSDIAGSIGNAYLRAGDAAAALPYARAHHQQQRALHGVGSARELSARMNLAAVLQKLAQYEASARLLESLVADMRREYRGKPNKMVAYAYGALGNQARLTNAYDEAARHWGEAEREARAAFGDAHPWLAVARYRRAEALGSGGHRDEALALLDDIAAIEGREDDLAGRAKALRDRLRQPK
jgi:tetratricopeptide (TPR) repeat protein